MNTQEKVMDVPPISSHPAIDLPSDQIEMAMENPSSHPSKTPQTHLASSDNVISLHSKGTPLALGKRVTSTPTEDLQELLSNKGLKVLKPTKPNELFYDDEEEEAEEVMTKPTPHVQTEPSSSVQPAQTFGIIVSPQTPIIG